MTGFDPWGRNVVGDEDDIIFENKFEYNESLLKELYKGMLKWDKQRKYNALIIYILLGINAAMDIIFIVSGNTSLLKVFICSLGFLSAVAIFRAVEPGILAKSALKQYNKHYHEAMDVRMTFNEDYMTTYDVSLGASMNRAIPYTDIQNVHESEHFIVLRMGKRRVMSVLKTGFTKGNVEEFRTFIMRKLKEVQSDDYDINSRTNINASSKEEDVILDPADIPSPASDNNEPK